jgi:glycine cleavage system regulatory protein
VNFGGTSTEETSPGTSSSTGPSSATATATEDMDLTLHYTPLAPEVESEEEVQAQDLEEPSQESADILNSLKKKRVQIYRSITRMSKTLNASLKNKSLAELKHILQTARNTQQILMSMTETIIEIHDDEDDTAKMNIYAEKLDECVAILQQFIEEEEEIFAHHQAEVDKMPGKGLNRKEPTNNESMLMATVRSLQFELNLVKQKQYLTTKKKEEPDYRGLSKLEPKKFGGEEKEYNYFKENFLAAVKGRNLSNEYLAMYLQTLLHGSAYRAIKHHVQANINSHTYKTMWAILDERFGGEHREDHYVDDLLENSKPMRDFSLKEIERILDLLTVLREYHQNIISPQQRQEHAHKESKEEIQR